MRHLHRQPVSISGAPFLTRKLVYFAPLALVIFGSACQVGCPFPADASVTVSGVLSPHEKNADMPEGCVLRMYYADDGYEVGYRNISGSFNTGFVVEPKVNSFYFTITCEGLGVCRTGTFRMGEKPPSHFDLGEIGLSCFQTDDVSPSELVETTPIVTE